MDPQPRNRRRRFLPAVLVLLLVITGVAWWRYAHRPLTVAAVISDGGGLLCIRDSGVVTLQRPDEAPSDQSALFTEYVRCYTWSGKLRWRISFQTDTREYGNEEKLIGISPDGHVAAVVKSAGNGLLVQSWRDGEPTQRVTLNPWHQLPGTIDCSVGVRNDGSLLVACGGFESPETTMYLLTAGKVTASGSYRCPPPDWIKSKIFHVDYSRSLAADTQTLFIRSYITHAEPPPTMRGVACSTEMVALRVGPPAIIVVNHFLYKQFNCRLHDDGSLTSYNGSRYDAQGQLSPQVKGNVYCTGDGKGQLTVTGTNIAVTHWNGRKAQSPWSATVPGQVIRPLACASPDGEYAFVLCPRRSQAFSLLCRVAGERLQLRESPTGKHVNENTWPYPAQMLLYRHGRRVAGRSLLLRDMSPNNPGYANVIDIDGRRVALDYNEPSFSPDGKRLLLSAYTMDSTNKPCHLILRVK